MLSVADLRVTIANAEILRDVALEVPLGSTVGLIGRNGAGKTTLMRSVMGLLPVRSGRIMLASDDITVLPAHRRARLGIGYMPEDRRLVPALTVEENVLVPAWAGGFADTTERLRFVYDLMPEVRGFASRRALQLSGGQQKLVALARALLSGTKLLLLDEPFEGVAPALAQRLVEVIRGLRGSGLSVLLSESDYSHSSELVDRVYVIERGAVEEKAAAAVGERL